MPDDARLLELSWLTRLEQGLGLPEVPAVDCPELRLIHYFAEAGLAQMVFGTGDEQRYDNFNRTTLPLMDTWKATAARVVGLQKHWRIAITHRGAARRAELEQQLKAGRIKDSLGLVWDGRHFRQDARIALLDASPAAPLGAIYADLNDVKLWNAIDHDTGTAAIRRYLEVVAELAMDHGEAYRLSGGADEVVVLLPGKQLQAAVAWARRLVRALALDEVAGRTLRAAVGVVVTTEATEPDDKLKARADDEQKRAKARSRDIPERPSVVAWAGGIEVFDGATPTG